MHEGITVQHFVLVKETQNRALNGLYSLSKYSRYLTLKTQYTNQHTDTANVLTAELLQHKAYKLLCAGGGGEKQRVNA